MLNNSGLLCLGACVPEYFSAIYLIGFIIIMTLYGFSKVIVRCYVMKDLGATQPKTSGLISAEGMSNRLAGAPQTASPLCPQKVSSGVLFLYGNLLCKICAHQWFFVNVILIF